VETLNILVVDDELGMRNGIKRVLDDYSIHVSEVDSDVSFSVKAVESGEEAITIIRKNPPYILLLDHKLPGISGIEVLEQIQNEMRDMQVIMITAYASIETAIRATKLGAYDFLPKPFTPTELKNAVRKAAEHIIVTIQAKKLVEEKRQVRFQFISVLAHELKAPLNAVEGYLKLMSDKSTIEDPEVFDHIVDRSLTRLSYMRKLIIDLLDMTRIESGKKQREIKEVNVTDIAKISMESMMPDASERNIKICLETDAPVLMEADQNEVEIVLNNLISNAVKYNRDNGGVFVSIMDSDHSVTIRVRDTGIGMTKEETDRLFNDFVRIKNEKTRNILGSGLGLSIVKKIANLYDGSVSVESKPDIGSTFKISLKKTSNIQKN